MKILFYLSRYPGWGGIETVTSLIIPELIKQGHQITIASHRQQFEAQSIPKDVRLVPIPIDSFNKHINEYDINNIIFESDRQGYDCIIYQDCYEPNEQLAVKMSLEWQIPLIVFEHNTPLIIFKMNVFGSITSIKGIIKRIFKPLFMFHYAKKQRKRRLFLHEHCHAYVLLSQNYIPEFHFITSLPQSNKLCIINNPLTFASQESPSFESKKNEILYVGRLVPEKRVDKILKVWSSIQKQFPHWKLTIVGDGPERKFLERLCNDQAIKRVHFVGFQKPIEYYSKAKIFLMASSFEGWPMTLAEAMSMGCVPVAEHNFSSLPDIIDHATNGIILPKDCPRSTWAEQLSHLLANEALLKKMSQNAVDKANTFSVQKIAEDWRRLLHTVHSKNE